MANQKLDWLRVLDGTQFGLWLESVAGGTRISQGQKLDPFGTSMRTSKAIAGWLSKVQAGVSLEPRGGAGAQNVTDLIGAGLVERDGTGTVVLTALGADVLAAWQKHGVADDTAENELPRCLILAKLGLEHGDQRYVSAYKFWTELRKIYPADDLLEAPEQLYTASYLNQEAAGINAWDLVAASAVKSNTLAPLDWANANSAALSTKAKAALKELGERVSGFATRATGRVRFCQAMELLMMSKTDSGSIDALLDEWKKR